MKPFPDLKAILAALEDLLGKAEFCHVETPEETAPETTIQLERRFGDSYQPPRHEMRYYRRAISYTPYNHQTAPEEMKKEMVRLYKNSLLTIEEIACYLKWRYATEISPSIVSKRAREALGVKSREEVLNKADLAMKLGLSDHKLL